MQVNKVRLVNKLMAGAGLIAVVAIGASLLSEPSTVPRIGPGAMRSLANGGAFKTIQGDGSRTLHVFLSTDCTYCRRVEPELAKLENVTIHRHMLPGRSESGRATAKQVWCSLDRSRAWTDVAAGRPVGNGMAPHDCSGDVLDANLELAKKLGVRSTPAMIFVNGEVSTGMQSAGALTSKLTEASVPQG